VRNANPEMPQRYGFAAALYDNFQKSDPVQIFNSPIIICVVLHMFSTFAVYFVICWVVKLRSLIGLSQGKTRNRCSVVCNLTGNLPFGCLQRDSDFVLMTWPGVFTMDLHGVGCCDVNSKSSKFQTSILSDL